MRTFQNSRTAIFALLVFPLSSLIGAGCEKHSNVDATGGATHSGGMGGSPATELCGGCAVVTVSTTSDLGAGAFTIQSFRPELIDLSHTIITYRFWAETDAPDNGGLLTFYAMNDFIRETFTQPMASVELPIQQASRWVEISLDLEALDASSWGGASSVGGADSMGGAEALRTEVEGITIVEPFDPREILVLGMMVTGADGETRVYLDSVTFSDATPDLNYDMSAEPSESFNLGNGVDSELSWIP